MFYILRAQGMEIASFKKISYSSSVEIFEMKLRYLPSTISWHDQPCVWGGADLVDLIAITRRHDGYYSGR